MVGGEGVIGNGLRIYAAPPGLRKMSCARIEDPALTPPGYFLLPLRGYGTGG